MACKLTGVIVCDCEEPHGRLCIPENRRVTHNRIYRSSIRAPTSQSILPVQCRAVKDPGSGQSPTCVHIVTSPTSIWQAVSAPADTTHLACAHVHAAQADNSTH
jgi:hypothetical protein